MKQKKYWHVHKYEDEAGEKGRGRGWGKAERGGRGESANYSVKGRTSTLKWKFIYFCANPQEIQFWYIPKFYFGIMKTKLLQVPWPW